MDEKSKKRKAEDGTVAHEPLHQFDKYIQSLSNIETIEKLMFNLEEQKWRVKHSKFIQNAVTQMGYAAIIHGYPIDGLHNVKLPYRVEAYSYDHSRTGGDQPFIVRSIDMDKQYDWVKACNIDMSISGNTDKLDVDVDYYNKDWSGDLDDPEICIGTLDIMFYYPTQPYPDLSKSFQLICLDTHKVKVRNFGDPFPYSAEDWIQKQMNTKYFVSYDVTYSHTL
jgi:hypothetical protein